MRFRKKVVEIDAIQWTGTNIHEIWDTFGAGTIYGPTEKNPDWLLIGTLEGDMRASLGDWIIRGVKGELYPCKPDIFELTYERIDEDMSDKTMGQVAFEAYTAAVGGKTFDGKPIPGWDELHGDRLKVQGGWEAAARAVVEYHEAHGGNVTFGPGGGVDYRTRQEARWTPVSNPPPPAEVQSLPDGAEVGELPPSAYTGQHTVTVDAEPDSDR